MAAVTFADDLVRDYLLYRGFMGALKAFDSEVKLDKDRGFRPDRIVEHMVSCINTLDLTALREAWSHLESRVFSRLERSFAATTKKLETALLRLYVVNCITNNRQEKLMEFFEKMTSELHGQSEWKEWFALPFLKNPEDNPSFQVYFTRQWQDTMLVSLHNFLSIVFQSMALPALLSYEEELVRINSLQEENENLKQQISSLMQSGDVHVDKRENSGKVSVQDGHIPAPPELMDDFYVIAQEAPSSENQGRYFKSLIKNFSSGLPTSPILGRRSAGRQNSEDVGSKPVSAVKPKPRTPSVPPPTHHSSAPPAVARVRPQPDQESNRKHNQQAANTIANPPPQKVEPRVQSQSVQHLGSSSGPMTGSSASPVSSPLEMGAVARDGNGEMGAFILLSQEKYAGHNSCITHCKFNGSGSVVASSDMDGVIKVWNPSLCPHTLATFISKGSVLALEWASKRERLLIYGNRFGNLRLSDTKERRTVHDVGSEPGSPLQDQRIVCLACSPTEACFVCSTSSSQQVSGGQGNLMLWDLRTFQFDRYLHLDQECEVVNCSVFNHNGQLLLTGTSSGKMCLFDMRGNVSIAQWNAHEGDVYSVQFSTDETSCFSVGRDGKFIQWSVNKTGEKITEFGIHAGATGPFLINGLQHHPVGKLFTFDASGNHVLTCGPIGGVIYSMLDCNSGMDPLLSLGGHKCPVVTVDWSTAVDCGTCIAGSLDGHITVSTLLAQ